MIKMPCHFLQRAVTQAFLRKPWKGEARIPRLALPRKSPFVGERPAQNPTRC